jgi:teichuronic acid biosynthesis glycosyltransferase TuaC
MSVAPLALFSPVLPVLQRQIHAGDDFDVIDTHYFYPNVVVAVLLGCALDRPVVVTACGSDLNVIAEFAVP